MARITKKSIQEKAFKDEVREETVAENMSEFREAFIEKTMNMSLNGPNGRRVLSDEEKQIVREQGETLFDAAIQGLRAAEFERGYRARIDDEKN